MSGRQYEGAGSPPPAVAEMTVTPEEVSAAQAELDRLAERRDRELRVIAVKVAQAIEAAFPGCVMRLGSDHGDEEIIQIGEGGRAGEMQFWRTGVRDIDGAAAPEGMAILAVQIGRLTADIRISGL